MEACLHFQRDVSPLSVMWLNRLYYLCAYYYYYYYYLISSLADRSPGIAINKMMSIRSSATAKLKAAAFQQTTRAYAAYWNKDWRPASELPQVKLLKISRNYISPVPG